MINSADILSAGILGVDDEEASVVLLERMLRGAGHISITPGTDLQASSGNQECCFGRKVHFP